VGGIELSCSELNSEPSSDSELNSELRVQVPTQTRARARAQTQAALEFGIELELPQLNPTIQATPDPIIEQAIAATQRARVSMVRKYTKKHDIQHFDIRAIVSIKVPREDRTSTDNKRLFARILEKPYPH
jgi:hypothetical protein